MRARARTWRHEREGMRAREARFQVMWTEKQNKISDCVVLNNTVRYFVLFYLMFMLFVQVKK